MNQNNDPSFLLPKKEPEPKPVKAKKVKANAEPANKVRV